MKKHLPISICILSWKSPKTLSHTLKSYQKKGLLEISDDITILFQEISPEDITLANKFQIPYIGLKENIGIGKGILQLMKNAQYENVLFLENDWQLTESSEIVYNRLEEGLTMLDKGYDVIRYRSRTHPGFPLHSLKHKGNELDYYDDWHQSKSPHLLESLHWLDPAEQFPDKIQKDGAFFVTTSQWANWTNNPFLIKKDFYIKNLSQFTGETLDLERKIAYWWTRQNFKIAQGEGLFTHNDIEKYPPQNLIKTIKNTLRNLYYKGMDFLQK